MFVFWFLIEVIISPTYNLFVQYTEAQIDLPILTQWAIDAIPFIGIMSPPWLALIVIVGMKLAPLDTAQRLVN